MSQVPSIGITRMAAVVHYVHDLDRARRFLMERLDFEEIGAREPDAPRRREPAVALRAGDCVIVVAAPLAPGGPAWRFLLRHPEGIGALVLEVEDVARAFALLSKRGGTPLTSGVSAGERAAFSIATPFGDTLFRFVQKGSPGALLPGFVPPPPSSPPRTSNRFGFGRVDHVTANLRTMAPALLWMEHVLGFRRSWEHRLHTGDASARGSGLRSAVMRDDRSGVTIACNEPLPPRVLASQVSVFREAHGGDGIQHVAVTTRDIVSAVRGMRARGVPFRPSPPAYHDTLPERLRRAGVGPIDEDFEVLRELSILADGNAPGRYLLQIFLEASARIHRDRAAGPFFFEIVQRKGDLGFGAGNFRALFESIERERRRTTKGGR